MEKYDIAIIGAGAGGLTAAFTAKGFGKKVALIDKDKPGGECTWSGCVPSKALINEAKRVFTVRNAVSEYKYDSSVAMAHLKDVRENIYKHENPEVLKKAGIDFIKGKAEFEDPKTLKVGEKIFKAKKIIISTGSSPFVPDIPGLKGIKFHTNETIFELEKLPQSLIVLGGGPIGAELSQALNRLGTRVYLVEMMPNIISREEKEFALSLQEKLIEEGVRVYTGSKAVQAGNDGEGIFLKIEKDGKDEVLKAETILVAVGRKANTDLGLKNAGITFDPKGVIVNSYLQTSNKDVYAVGDVTGPYNFSHMANAQGILAVKNAILPFKKKMKYENVPWVTFTDPELARTGLTESEAVKKHGRSIRVYDYDFNDLDRAITKGKTNEKMKLVLDKKGKILGVTILAQRAGEMIGEAQLIKTLNLNFSKLASVIHPYPTYSEVFVKTGKKVLVDNILNNPIVKFVRRFSK